MSFVQLLSLPLFALGGLHLLIGIPPAEGADLGRGVRLIGRSDLGGWGDAAQVFVKGRYAFIGHSNEEKHRGTTILDVSDPKNPKFLSRIPAPPRTLSHKAQVCDNILVVNNHRFPAREGGGRIDNPGLRIYDVSDPVTPKPISEFRTGGRGVHRFKFDCTNRFAYLPTGDEDFTDAILWIVDLKEPRSPRLVSKWWIPGMKTKGEEREAEQIKGEAIWAHGMPHLDRNTLYVSFRPGRLIILDATKIDQLKFLGQFNFTPPYPGRFHSTVPVKGKDLLIATNESSLPDCQEEPARLWVMDIRNKRNPIPIASYLPEGKEEFCRKGGRFGAHNIHEEIDGPLVYSVWFNAGLRILDISDPYKPKEIASYVPPADFGKPAVQLGDIFVDERGLIYVTDRWGGGLYILEYTRKR